MADLKFTNNNSNYRNAFGSRNRSASQNLYTTVDAKSGEVKTYVNNVVTTTKTRDVNSSVNVVFTSILIVLLLINVFKLMYSGEDFQFTGVSQLLGIFTNAYTLDLSFMTDFQRFTFGGLTDVAIIGPIISFFKDLLGALFFIGAGLVQLIIYIGYFIGALLGL